VQNFRTIAIGFSTILGTLGLIAGIIIPLIGELADTAEPLGVPPQTWVVMGSILGGLVILGRMAQAVALGLKAPPTPPPGA
jgi:hypothetical protein